MHGTCTYSQGGWIIDGEGLIKDLEVDLSYYLHYCTRLISEWWKLIGPGNGSAVSQAADLEAAPFTDIYVHYTYLRVMEADYPEDEALLAISQAADLEAALFTDIYVHYTFLRVMEADYPEDEALLAISQAADLEDAIFTDIYVHYTCLRVMEAEYPEDEALLAISQAADLEAALALLNRECELCTTVMNIKEVWVFCSGSFKG